jgi:hypothetical protein
LRSGRRDSNPRRQPWQDGKKPFRRVTKRFGISNSSNLALPDDPTRYAWWPLWWPLWWPPLTEGATCHMFSDPVTPKQAARRRYRSIPRSAFDACVCESRRGPARPLRAGSVRSSCAPSPPLRLFTRSSSRSQPRPNKLEFTCASLPAVSVTLRFAQNLFERLTAFHKAPIASGKPSRLLFDGAMLRTERAEPPLCAASSGPRPRPACSLRVSSERPRLHRA